MDTVYAAYVPAMIGQQPRVFQICARVFREAQAYRLTIPWGLEHIEAVLDLLEHEIIPSIAAQ
jgi:hypothetical protein